MYYTSPETHIKVEKIQSLIFEIESKLPQESTKRIKLYQARCLLSDYDNLERKDFEFNKEKKQC